jgi:hypothetical protein
VVNVREFHRAFDNGLAWRLRLDGVELEQSGTMRTPGVPLTIRKIWRDYAAPIQHAARVFGVPVEYLLATIATESIVRDGLRDPRQIREEPGFRSDTDTPHKISVGLCHILIETATRTMRVQVSRGWLSVPANNILCAAWVIRDGADVHGFDGPRVAAAYNAGTVAETNKNRWRMRSTNDHLDRFCRFLGDAVAVVRDAGGCQRDWVWFLAMQNAGLL